MSQRVSLQWPACRRLQELDRKGSRADLRVRIRVTLKAASGLSCNATAREVGCVPSTAVRTVARFVREGEASLMDHLRENGARKVDDNVVARVRAILAAGPVIMASNGCLGGSRSCAQCSPRWSGTCSRSRMSGG